MRVVVAAVVAACMGLTGVAHAEGAGPAGKRQVDIPAQPLGQALQLLAKAHGFQLVYVSKEVGALRTQGVSGEYDASDALDQLLSGSGLTYRYVNEKTVMVFPVTSSATSRAAAETTMRLAQVSALQSQQSDSAATEVAATDLPASAVEEIVVTSTRVERAGYEAPTPTTVITDAQIRAMGHANVADYLNQMPAVAGSITPRTGNGQLSSGTAGANFLNLRNLGPNRTLVMLDSRRVAPSTVTGGVDVNLLPTMLLQRVDVVTGGASAAWGSDAVAGVVNFVLDKSFTGLKASVQGGVTDYEDGRSGRFDLAGGAPFADGRGHVLFTAQFSDIDAVGGAGTRDWYSGSKVINNPARTATNGAPLRVVMPDVGLARATDGGVITSTALQGIQFGPGGAPIPFDAGFASGQQSVGGDAEDPGARLQLQGALQSRNFFGRLSYEVAESVELFGEASYANVVSDSEGVSFMRLGNLTIRNDNAFLDPGIRAQMQTLGIANFNLGRTNWDLGPTLGHNERELTRFVVGAQGELAGYKWSAYYQRGETDLLIQIRNNAILSRYAQALDAVSSGGRIVCRSTLTNPGNDCIPFNPFGFGSPSAAAIDYVNGTAWQDVNIEQDVAAASVSGTPLNSWAGPISIAAGVEYRKEAYDAEADAISLTNGFFVGNFKSSGGEYNVKEGFFETVVPLVSGVTLAESLDFNGAVRVVDYSRSGTVTPWKAGLTYDVTDELRFRAIRSRDIRAPNLNDLFQAGSGGSALIVDPLTGTQVQVPVQRIGNPELEPEAANTTSFGVVLRPEWLPGFSASIDYFKIRLRGAIGNLSGQQVVDQCVAGEANLCSFVVRNPGGAITQVLSPGLNIDEERTSGVDLDLRYGLPVHLGALEGKLNLGAIGTYTHERVVETSVQSLDYAGQLGDAEFATPQWRWHFIANYVQGDTSATLQGRYIGSGQLNNAWSAADIVDNSVASVFYLDLAGARAVRLGDSKAQLFVAIDNVFDRAAPVSPVISGQQHLNYGANSYVYDLIGRSYRAGVRFEF